jgi:hypothetical protein
MQRLGGIRKRITELAIATQRDFTVSAPDISISLLAALVGSIVAALATAALCISVGSEGEKHRTDRKRRGI